VKKVLLIVVVAALALTLVPLAIAGAPGGGGWKHGKAKFNLVGKVVVAPEDVTPAVDPAIDAAAADVVEPVEPVVSTIFIEVKAGTKSIRAFRGKVAEFMAADARVWLLTGDGAVPKTLADIEPGDRVKARGTIKDGVFTIKTLKYRDLTPEEDTAPVEPSPAPAAR
jgi:hypothetical protein